MTNVDGEKTLDQIERMRRLFFDRDFNYADIDFIEADDCVRVSAIMRRGPVTSRFDYYAPGALVRSSSVPDMVDRAISALQSDADSIFDQLGVSRSAPTPKMRFVL